MSDPRNVAHDKKVKQEKEHEKPEPTNGSAEVAAPAAAAATDQGPDEHEQSVAVLSKLKEMEFHSRGNIETLAQLSLTIEDELKQKEFSDPVAAVYSAQDAFQKTITDLIASYETKCDSLKLTA